MRQICGSGLASNFHQVPQRFPRLIFNFGDPIMTCSLGSGFQADRSIRKEILAEDGWQADRDVRLETKIDKRFLTFQ